MNEKEREKTRRELRKVADEFLRVVKEKVDICVLLCDSKGLSELVSAVDIVSGWQLVKTIQEKGFSKEFLEFCDKVGRGKQ
jgi:hypothetical protein